ncbi:MAG: hypothetical protein VKK80_15970 [Prochlorothrix sp.]|nr:hypothetical protein [Prochlorothrix sp.]
MARRSPRPPLKNPEFEQALDSLSEKLTGLRQRYSDICADQARLDALSQAIQQHQANPQRETQQTVDPELTATLEALQREFNELEAQFEGQFMSWDGIGTLFWQIVRFGGLGLVLGWGLRSIVA